MYETLLYNVTVIVCNTNVYDFMHAYVTPQNILSCYIIFVTELDWKYGIRISITAKFNTYVIRKLPILSSSYKNVLLGAHCTGNFLSVAIWGAVNSRFKVNLTVYIHVIQ